MSRMRPYKHSQLASALECSPLTRRKSHICGVCTVSRLPQPARWWKSGCNFQWFQRFHLFRSSACSAQLNSPPRLSKATPLTTSTWSTQVQLVGGLDLHLLGHPGLGSVELEEKCRSLRQSQLAVLVARCHLHLEQSLPSQLPVDMMLSLPRPKVRSERSGRQLAKLPQRCWPRPANFKLLSQPWGQLGLRLSSCLPWESHNSCHDTLWQGVETNSGLWLVRDFSFVCNSVCVCTLGCETWVITPRVPSLPRKSSVRLYPADVFLSQTTTSALKMKFFSAKFAPWSCSIACRLYNLAVRKHHFKIHTVLFHCSISGCERLSIIAPSDYLWCLTALVPLAPVAHIPHIDASRIKMALYCQQGSGALRQQLLMMHGIAWYCMVLHWIA